MLSPQVETSRALKPWSIKGLINELINEKVIDIIGELSSATHPNGGAYVF